MIILKIVQIVTLSIISFCFFVIIIKPQVLANVYIKYYPEIISTYKIDDFKNLKVIEYENKYKIYKFNEDTAEKNSPIVVFITGGFFVRSSPELKILSQITNKRILVTFNYPVLFDNTMTECYNFIKRVICDYITMVYPTKDIILLSHSAGSFYSLLFDQDNHENNLKINIKKFIGVNGFYGNQSFSNFIYKLGSWYYLEKNSKLKLNSRINTKDCLVLTTTNDFLKTSSEYISKENNIKISVYEGNHTTFSDINDINNKTLLNTINSFILAV